MAMALRSVVSIRCGHPKELGAGSIMMVKEQFRACWARSSGHPAWVRRGVSGTWTLASQLDEAHWILRWLVT